MIEVALFKEWLSTNTSYSDAVISDIASRMKRADNIVTWEPTKHGLCHHIENSC